MTRVRILFILLVYGLLLPMVTASSPPEKEKITLYGQYVWNAEPNSPGDLRAEFIPQGDNNWKVAFYFKFSGRNHTYKGDATGTLKDGTLKGQVKNENGRRTWNFEGAFENGTFSGSHAEIRGSGERRSGTLSLTPKS